MPALADLTDARLADIAAGRGVPSHLIDGLVLYILHGIPPGSFLEAVLSNDLMGAFARADEDSRLGLHQLVMFLYNDVPQRCHGGPLSFKTWIQDGGLKGREDAGTGQ